METTTKVTTNTSVPTVNTQLLAVASLLAYCSSPEEISGNKFYQILESNGFKLHYFEEGVKESKTIAFKNEETNVVVLAVRGTKRDNLWDIISDIGIFISLMTRHDPGDVFFAWIASSYLGTEITINQAKNFSLVFNKVTSWMVSSICSTLGFQNDTLNKIKELFEDSKIMQVYKDMASAGESFKHIPSVAPKWLQQEIGRVEELQKKFNEEEKSKLVLTGHSLGGFIAQVVAAEYGIECVTFNAPGALHWMEIYEKKHNNGVNIKNYVRKSDFAASFGAHLGEKVFVPAHIDEKNTNFADKLVLNHGIASLVDYFDPKNQKTL